MKKLAVAFFAIFSVMLLCAPTLVADSNKAKIQFKEKTYDFGTVNRTGGDVLCEFTYANEGDAPLVITSATSSCGCSKVEYKKAPVAPGEQGKISIVFNPRGQRGEINKAITVRTNDPRSKKVTLRITGVVIE